MSKCFEGNIVGNGQVVTAMNYDTALVGFADRVLRDDSTVYRSTHVEVQRVTSELSCRREEEGGGKERLKCAHQFRSPVSSLRLAGRTYLAFQSFGSPHLESVGEGRAFLGQ